MEKCNKIAKLRTSITQKDFSSKSAMEQYVGVNSRPDICSTVQLISPGAEPTSLTEFKIMNKVVKI